MFTKESCGPCGLVKRYITALKDPRESVIEEIYLDDEKLYFCSLSSKTIVYKGLMLPKDIENFYMIILVITLDI